MVSTMLDGRPVHPAHHFKSKAGIDGQQDKVGHLGHIDHGVHVVGALDEGQAALLA